MQCPPSPGPGVNFMNPNGFVAAASMTSQMSTSSRSAITAASLTSPMFTARKVFSRILVSSAASVEDTGTMVSIRRSYIATPAAVQAGVMPPITFGVLCVIQVSFPGSTRSGEKQRKKSSPTLSPVSCSAGSMMSRVVPGYVVDSRMISCPFRSAAFTEAVAAMM